MSESGRASKYPRGSGSSCYFNYTRTRWCSIKSPNRQVYDMKSTVALITFFLGTFLWCFASAATMPSDRQQSHLVIDTPLPNTSTSFTDHCESCKQLIDDAKSYIEDPQTQQAMIALIDVNICPLVPQQFVDTCKAEVPIVVAEIMASIDQSVSSNDICTSLGACSTTSFLITTTMNNNEEEEGKEEKMTITTTSTESVECPLCHIVVTTLIMRMKDPETRDNIEDQAREACKQLPEDDRVDKCMADVDGLFNSIDALLEDVDVDTACRVLEFCDDDNEEKRKEREGVKQLKHLASQLVLMTPSTTSSTRSSDNDDKNCETCKTIVMEAAAVLTNPQTQQEVMEYAKQACSVMDEYKEQCEQYVQLYGPLVFTMAVSYLQPGPLCERLGYCDGGVMMMMGGEVVV